MADIPTHSKTLTLSPLPPKTAGEGTGDVAHTDGRPIWTVNYDKRFCFSASSLATRIAYVERHNTDRGWPAKPWDFIELP